MTERFASATPVSGVEHQASPAANFFWRAYCDVLHRHLLRRWLPRGDLDRVLKTDLYDEACRTGLLCDLSGPAWIPMGIDISYGVAQACRRRHRGIHAATADVRRLPFRPESFGMVLSNSTLDHFADSIDIEISLHEIHRVLRSGGGLILTLDNPLNPVVFLRNTLPLSWLRRLRLVPYDLGRTVSRRRLVRCLSNGGFKVVHMEALMHCPRLAAVALGGWLSKRCRRGWQERYIRSTLRFEALSRLPTRFLTGYFLAVSAVKI